MDIKYLFKDFIYVRRSRGTIQDFINRRYKSEHFPIVDSRNVTHVMIKNCFILPLNNQRNDMITQVYSEYDFSNIETTDIVLDIGANVGIFSLAVKDKVKRVYAVEPLFFEELSENIRLNKVENITALNYALSNTDIKLEFEGKTGYATGKTLNQLKKMCGGHVDFLKCDCEGGEWCIQPDELEGIRRIEIEVHSFNGEKLYDFPEMLKSAGYCVRVDPRDDYTILVHAFSQR